MTKKYVRHVFSKIFLSKWHFKDVSEKRQSVRGGFLRTSGRFISELALVDSEESYSGKHASGNRITWGIGVLSNNCSPCSKFAAKSATDLCEGIQLHS